MATEIVTWQKYPGTGNYHSQVVYSLDAQTIDNIVPNDKPHGNYKIYRKTIQGLQSYFKVIYVGRVADRTSDKGLKERIKEHINDWKGDLFFDYKVQATAKAAYNRECTDYHTWKNAGQADYNNVHPAKLDDNCTCPVCGN